MTKLPSLSVFFPAYNEEKNILPLVKQALDFLPQVATKFEVIVVDDGSQDKTGAIAQQLVQQFPQVKVVTHAQNQGYGAALKTGIGASQYEWIFFTDADLQFDITELKSFLPSTQKYRVILGYRTNRAEGFSRVRNAYLFKIFVDLLFRVHVKDIDCAFKLFRANVIKPLEIESNGAFTSAEILYKLKKNRVAFKQLPVTHYSRRWGNPTGANWRVVAKAGYEAINIYLKLKLERLSHLNW
ncbi:glycosyltransferase family 2 protein [Patescibacteria group bacterium]|nr:glycosyltransferase family 2 protein [Patescibacteria group bacterium]